MSTATAKCLTEITQATRPVRVDREAGEIRGVKIIGTESRNGRQYPKPVLLAAVSKYEGRKAYINHPAKGSETIERRYEDWAGRFQNVHGDTVDGEFGLYGDLKLRKGGQHYEALLADAEDAEFCREIGVSHVAVCESDYVDGVEVISEIVEVLSGDIVTDPATTAGLFESKDHQTMTTPAAKKPKTVKRSLAEIRDAQPAGSVGARLLMEMEGDMAAMEVEAPADASPDGLTKAAIRDLVMAAIDDDSLDAAATMARIKQVLKLTEQEAPKAEEPAGDEPAAPTEESRKLSDALAKLARMEAKAVLLESGREATDIRVKTLAAASSDADRRALVESWPKLTQRNSGRPEASPGVVTESVRFGDDLDDVSDEEAAAYEKRLLEAAGR